jgi:hypothetical protein
VPPAFGGGRLALAGGELVLAEEMHALAPRGPVFLSVSREELLTLRALALPPDRFVLCPQLPRPLDDDLNHALDRHAMRGFRLALDSGDLAALSGPLLGRAQTVIVEVGAWSSDQLAKMIAAVRERASPAELVAAGVHTRRSFEICRRLGFDLFQGQFFLTPTDKAKAQRRRGRPWRARDDGRAGGDRQRPSSRVTRPQHAAAALRQLCPPGLAAPGWVRPRGSRLDGDRDSPGVRSRRGCRQRGGGTS